MGLTVTYYYSYVLRILQLPLLKTLLNLFYPFFFLSFRVILIACTKKGLRHNSALPGSNFAQRKVSTCITIRLLPISPAQRSEQECIELLFTKHRDYIWEICAISVLPVRYVSVTHTALISCDVRQSDFNYRFYVADVNMSIVSSINFSSAYRVPPVCCLTRCSTSRDFIHLLLDVKCLQQCGYYHYRILC